MTFSIVACDLRSRSWGVAVASKFLAIGSMVPAAQATVGAIATQARTNAAFRSLGLSILGDGHSAPEALSRLLADDPGRDARQVGIVDGEGRVRAVDGARMRGAR